MKRESGVALCLLALIVLGAWSFPLLLPGYVGFDGDNLFLFYPALNFAREEIFSGRAPLWNPYKFLGSPLIADLMVPMFYPPQFLALMPPQPLGQHLGIVAHAVWAAIGAYLAARRGFGASAIGGLLAGITFDLCAPMQAHASHPNQFFAMAWLPWVLAASLNWARSERRWEAGLILGLVLGMQCLAGQPQIVGYSGVIVLLAMIEAMTNGPRHLAHRILPLGAASALALCLAAVHLVPAFELSRYSLREGGTLEFAESFSLPLGNLKTLLLPGAFGSPASGGYHGAWNFTETAVFCGQAALALAIAGLFHARRRRETWIVVVGMIAIGLVWALGGSTPIYGWVLKLAPPLAQFRAPARAFILVVLGVSMAGGVGADGVRRWIAGSGPNAGRTRAAIAIVAFLILLQGLSLIHFRFRVLGPEPTRMEDAVVPGWDRFLSGVADGDGRVFRLMTEIDYGDVRAEATTSKVERLQPDVNVLHRISILSGYEEGMLPKRDYVHFVRGNRRRIFAPEPDTVLLGLMGIRYILADKPVMGSSLRLVRFDEGVALVENRDYRGMVFTRGHWPEVNWEAFDEGREDVLSLREESAGDESPGMAAKGGRPLSSSRIAPSRVHVQLADIADRRIILSETWMPGWIAVTDEGTRVPGRRLAPFLIEFDMPEGVKSAEILYRPRSFAVGLGVSGGAVAVLLIVGALVIRRRRDLEDPPFHEAGAE